MKQYRTYVRVYAAPSAGSSSRHGMLRPYLSNMIRLLKYIVNKMFIIYSYGVKIVNVFFTCSGREPDQEGGAMLNQKDYDKISHIKEQDFITIMTALQGGVDWEYLIILYAMNEYKQALKFLNKGGCWKRAAKEYEERADKAMNYLNTFRKLNA